MIIVIIGQDGSTCDSGSGDGMSVKQDSDENVGIDKDGWGTYSSHRKSGGDGSGDSFFYIFLFFVFAGKYSGFSDCLSSNGYTVIVVVLVVRLMIVTIVIVIVVVRHWCVIGTRDRNLLAIAASYLSFSSGNENYQGF